MIELDAARSQLSDPAGRIRTEALRSLGAHGGPAAIPDILRLQSDGDDFVRGTVYEALGRIAEGIEPEMLMPGLTDADNRTRAFAIRACEHSGLRATAPQITPLLRDSDPVVRSQAAMTLGAWKSAEALPAIERALADEQDAGLRGELYYARLRMPDAAERWTQLESEDWETRHTAMRRMDHTGITGGGPTLGRWLRSPHAGERAAAAAALACSDLPDREILFDCLTDDQAAVRSHSLAVLEDYTDDAIMRVARATVESPVGGFCLSAIRYLGRHGSDEDAALIRRHCVGSPSAETDAARAAIAMIEGSATVPFIDDVPDAIELPRIAERLEISGQAEDRVHAGVLRILSGSTQPDGALAILDRAWARGADAAAAVTVALTVSSPSEPQDANEKGAFRRELILPAIVTWEDLGAAITAFGLPWSGIAKGRISAPLHTGGKVSLLTLLLRLAQTRPPRAPVSGESLDFVPTWRAVDHATTKLTVKI